MKKFKTAHFILIAVIIVVVWVWTGYNGLVTASEKVDESWAQVETQYQRRIDLIPNLVSTVKGAAEFEQETFLEVTKARTQWQQAPTINDKVAAGNQFDSAFSRLLLTFENYPQLQATQAYRDLMTQLEGTENRVAVARRDFNQQVRKLNIKVKRFPTNILAGLFGYEPGLFFESVEGSEEAPVVDFEGTE